MTGEWDSQELVLWENNVFSLAFTFPRQFLGSASPVRLSKLLQALTLTVAPHSLIMRP